jgi:hypothetical protein
LAKMGAFSTNSIYKWLVFYCILLHFCEKIRKGRLTFAKKRIQNLSSTKQTENACHYLQIQN